MRKNMALFKKRIEILLRHNIRIKKYRLFVYLVECLKIFSIKEERFIVYLFVFFGSMVQDRPFAFLLLYI